MKEKGQTNRIEIPLEADSLSIDGWDIDNSQQQAYIRAVNRHLIRTIDTKKDEEEDEDKENHGIIGCGTYYPWVTQKDQWTEALQKAEAETGYRASWHWNMERGEVEEITDWETGERKPKELREPLPKEEGWYDEIAKPYQKAYIERMPYPSKSGQKSPWRKSWEAEREQRFQKTLKRHQEMFAELLGNR